MGRVESPVILLFLPTKNNLDCSTMASQAQVIQQKVDRFMAQVCDADLELSSVLTLCALCVL